MPRKKKLAPVKAFLSHSSKNATFANRLAKVLTDPTRGIEVFYSKKSIRGAQEWHDEIGAGLKRSNWFVLLLSPESVKSKWVKHELIYALQANRYQGRIVPVLYMNCDPDQLSWTLSGFQRIDFRRRFKGGCRELLALWKLK